MCTLTVVPARQRPYGSRSTATSCGATRRAPPAVALVRRRGRRCCRSTRLPAAPGSASTTRVWRWRCSTSIRRTRRHGRAPSRSRGHDHPRTARHATLLSKPLSAAAGTSHRREYAPFRLVLVARRRDRRMLCGDGDGRSSGRRPALDDPVLFTSSGLGDHLVEGPRRRPVRSAARLAGRRGLGRQDAFHRHRWPDRAAPERLHEPGGRPDRQSHGRSA